MTALALAKAVLHSPTKPMSQVVWLPRLERGRRQARAIASELGHVLGIWQDDTETSSVAQCLVCEDFAAVDAGNGQPTELCGRVLSRACAGPAIY